MAAVIDKVPQIEQIRKMSIRYRTWIQHLVRYS